MNILFDLDGTLLDTAPDFLFAVQSLRREENLLPLSIKELAELRPMVSNGLMALVKAGFGVEAEEPAAESLAQRLLEQYQKILGDYTKPFPGVESLLTALHARKIPWGIVTNKPQYLTEHLLKQQSCLQTAACIVCGDTTPYAKPHPEPLFYACRQLNILPANCLYVGDAERDILAGRAAGMRTIAALFGYIETHSDPTEWAADYYVTHANEILPTIEQWSQLFQPH